GRHPADAVVVGVGDEEVARGVHGDAGRGLELGGGRQAVVAEEAGSAGAGDRADVPARRDLADAVVVGVGNEKVTRGVDGDTGRGRQLYARGGAPVAAEAGTPGAGGGRDDPGRRRDLTDAVVIRVRDEEVARGVDRDTRRGLELGAGGGAAVVDRVTPAAGDRRDDPAPSRHLADAVVRGVRDEEV